MMLRIAPALAGIVILALWLGAAVLVAAVVAPAAFAVLPTRTLAGALVGRVLPVVFWSGMVIGIAAIAVGRSSGAGAIALAGALTTFIGCAVAQLVVAPRIERVRSAIAGPVEALAIADPIRREFGRLHGMSVLAMGVAGVGAAVTLLVLCRLVATRSTP